MHFSPRAAPNPTEEFRPIPSSSGMRTHRSAQTSSKTSTGLVDAAMRFPARMIPMLITMRKASFLTAETLITRQSTT